MEIFILVILWIVALAGGGGPLSTTLAFAAMLALAIMLRNTVTKDEYQNLRRELDDANRRLSALANEVKSIRHGGSAFGTDEQELATPSIASKPQKPVHPESVPVVTPTHPPVAAKTPAAAPIHAVPSVVAATPPTREVDPQPAYRAPATPIMPPPIATHQVAAPPVTHVALPKRSSFDIEELLGTNWLNKIGIFLLVIGIVFFLATQWSNIPAIGKDALLLVAAGGLLGGGIWFERRERYRVLGHTFVGGGWSILYFTAYAVQHIAPMRLFASEFAGLLLMGVTAGAMIWHLLRYRSQVVTGISYLLAFVTVVISHSDLYTLGANAVLLASLVFLVLRFGWFELEVFGIVASYAAHVSWLVPIVSARAPHQGFPQWTASTALLCTYWAMFRASYLLRGSDALQRRAILTRDREQVSTVACILNTILFLGVMKYQSAHPEMAFWGLLVLGALEFVLGLLPITRKRRLAFINQTVMGTALMVAAVPFRFSGANISILWMVGAEALLAAGLAAKETVFRRLSLIVNGCVALYTVVMLAFPFINGHVGKPHHDLHLAVTLLVISAVLYFNTHAIAERFANQFTSANERDVLNIFSYAAGASLAVGLWALLPSTWLCVGCAAVMIAFAAWSDRNRNQHLRIQAYGFAILSAGRVFFDLQDQSAGHWSPALVPAILCCAALYAGAYWLRESKRAVTWLGSAVAALVLWFALPTIWVCVGWALMMLALAAVSDRMNNENLRAQAHAFAGASFLHIVADGTRFEPGGWSALLLPAIVCIPLFYAAAIWMREAKRIITWPGSALAVLVLWYWLQPINVAPAWTGLALLLLEVGIALAVPALCWQAYLLFAAAFARIFFVNLNAVAQPGTISPRLYSMLPMAVALLYAYWRARHQDKDEVKADLKPVLSGALAYLGVTIVALLVRFDGPYHWVAAGWALLVGILLAVLWRTRTHIWLQLATILALLAAGRVIFVDLFERSYFVNVGLTPFVVTLVLLVAELLLARRFRNTELTQRTGVLRAFNRPDLVWFFAPVAMLTLMIVFLTRSGAITLAWGIEAMGIFVFALWIGERVYRLTALAILALCIGKLFAIDFWDMGSSDRYVTLIVLGAVLLAISFLYSKYKEKLRQLL
ncbi:MAG TPA: DUF2339 domain-containing protein [Terriglobales bacterium]